MGFHLNKNYTNPNLGTGGSAFVLGELFPEAKVMGIDLAPTYIRFDRAEKQIRKASNVEFYQANAEDMFFIESNSVDFINFAYVLHEMPAENARRVVNEMYRILKPGGVLNGLESPYERNPVAREAFVLTQTWGHDWSVQVTIYFIIMCKLKFLEFFIMGSN